MMNIGIQFDETLEVEDQFVIMELKRLVGFNFVLLLTVVQICLNSSSNELISFGGSWRLRVKKRE